MRARTRTHTHFTILIAEVTKTNARRIFPS